jgi:metal-responsive CopG/Arc/MetJ family transcriptional regulator
MATAKQTAIRLTDEDFQILDVIQSRMGFVTRSDAMRFALRQYAQANGIRLKKPKSNKNT